MGIETNHFVEIPSYFSMLKTELLLLPFSFNSFIALNILGSTLGFIGLLLLFEVLNDLYEGCENQLKWAFFYIPTVCYYSCGIVKEGIALLAMGILLHFFYAIYRRKKISLLLFLSMTFCLPIAIIAKGYIFPLYVIGLIFGLSYERLVKLSLLRKIITSILISSVGLGGIYCIGVLDERFNVSLLIDSAETVQQFTIYASESKDGKGNYEVLPLDFSSLLSVSKMIGQGIELAFLRPYFWEAKTPLFILASLETVVTLCLLLRFFIFFQVSQNKFIALVFLFFVLPFSVLVAVSNANFGSLLRYKLPMMPFLYSFLLLWQKKLSSM